MITAERQKQIFNNFREEAESFFITKLITSETLIKEYVNCIDIIYNISKTVDSNRGIIAFNKKYGQGKSFFFDVIAHRHRRRKGKNLFVKISAKEICDYYLQCPKNEDPIKRLNKFIAIKNLFIDDIGEELKDGVYRTIYGNKLNVIRYVLLRRYEMWLSKGWRTFGTTNLTIDEIAKNYDGRVADRIQEMTYWRHFNFVTGTFRQMKDTRRLTQLEISENWKKFKPKEKEPEKVDLIKYFNELINESDEYFENKDLSFWTFTKEFLIENNLLSAEDLNAIDPDMLDAAKLKLRSEVRASTRNQLKHAGGSIVNAKVEQALSEITRKNVYETAENVIVKRKFMELRKQKYVFK